MRRDIDVPVDPDVGIPDLVRSLTDDSRRLATDEVRLAKLELRERLHTSARGVLWLVLAFGAATVALVALTIGLVSVLASVLNGHVWAGAMIVGAIELILGALLVRGGLHELASPSYSLEESRAALADTAAWMRHPKSE